MLITSVNNDRIKELVKLKEKKYRDITNTFLFEGEHLLYEAYKANLIKEIFVLYGTDISLDVKITYVNENVMKKLSSMESTPNVIGVAYKKKEDDVGDKILVLEDIQDPGNLGTIIRSSLAFNIDGVVLSPNTVDLYNPKVIRSTKGMIFHINIIVRELEEFITSIKEEGYRIYGTKVDNGTDVKGIEVPSKYALIIGNEGNGMSNKISNLCDENLYIKMNDKVESLNAGVATSILLYEMSDK